ncbi:MAG: OsmC family protein [Pirellulaceae bacterium]
MDADALRAQQAPLKQQYQDDPASARIVMTARGAIHTAAPACTVNTDLGSLVAGLHPAAGGDGSQACSGDMMLQALVACSGVTFSAVAIAMGIPINSASVTARGEMDFRGTLGVDRHVAVGMTSVELEFQIDSSAEDAKLSKLVELTERYCVVLQTLAKPAQLVSRWKR